MTGCGGASSALAAASSKARDIAGYYVRLAVIQAQGFVVLAKARQALSLPPVDYTPILKERLQIQVAIVERQLTRYDRTPWNTPSPYQPNGTTEPFRVR
ncbi:MULTISPECIES: hypothetical protein [unclassified Streptomyces]|uniref:hypothetical protein n=1 Tax=unclassified Streptomyces TaxID=2593676 RepID=UPI0022714E04|nr:MULTISPECIES: hypothetical protein [unclassified Streptomyces]MCY0924128.1 hypothetical protein [Streptomyces sp. H27-G5]MCY0963166.1 hypothetical protein [Streptomyces sp. H27-H5]